MKRNRNPSILVLTTAVITSLAPCSAVNATEEVPARLPAPDGKPGDVTKPVKVYILAGQSNMVGMGELGGARNLYTGMFLSSDPAVPAGPLPIYKVGNYKIDRLAVSLPDGKPTDQAVPQGLLEVPEKGVYQVHCGFGGNSYNAMELDGKEVYHRDAGKEPVVLDITLEAGKPYPFKISGFQGDPPRFWMQKMDLLGHGDLETVTQRDKKFPWLLDDEGKWTVRNDVWFQEARVAPEGKGSPLSATSNGKSIGPELGFGYVMGTFHDEQVLLIKTAMGNRALGFDFRPPSSGPIPNGTEDSKKWESLEYKLMIEGVHKTLDQIDKVVPGYKGQGYEMAGFFWWQGHKDSFTPDLITEYEKNLSNLINDIRKEFKAPKMPAVVATIGFHGHHMSPEFQKIFEAQMAVGDPKKHPEFAGTVASVDTRDYWREVDESPTSQDYHYNRNAETYMRVGDALGRAMVALQGGKAEPLPQPDRPKRAPEAAAVERTEAEMAADQVALTPIILDGIAPSYATNPKNTKAILSEAKGEKPQRANQFLQGALDALVTCYDAAGIHDYDWHTFGPDLRDVKWDYISFDPKEPRPQKPGQSYRKVSAPDGMADWASPDFDAAKAGWKSGLPPFGQLDGKLAPLRSCTRDGDCGCGEKPNTLWEKEVLMARGNFEIPPLKDGYRYRLVVGGSNHVNAGEGYAIHVNGKLLAESNSGVGKRQGGQPRGGHVFADFRNDFRGGKVTLAATGFLRYGPAPSGHFTLWMEEQKIPPLPELAATDK